MVTPRRRPSRRLFLKEHRKAKGLSAEQMAQRLGIERESVYRRERQTHRMNPKKQAQYAAIFGVDPEDLWRPPGAPGRESLDELTQDLDEAEFARIRQIIVLALGLRLES